MCIGFLHAWSLAYTHSQDNASICGQLLMRDDKTPHVACVVQTITPSDENGGDTVVATMLSDENGKYQFLNLKPGMYRVRCYTLEGNVYYQEGKLLHVGLRQPLTNIDFRFAPFKKGTWRSYSAFKGLASNLVKAIHRYAQGTMWFGTNEGVSRYDGETFVNFNTKDELADTDLPHTVQHDPI